MSDLRFVIAVAALASGLSAFAAGFNNPDGLLGLAAPVARDAQVAGDDHGADDLTGVTARALAPGLTGIAGHPHRFSGDGSAGMDRHHFRMRHNARDYLMATAAAHRSQHVRAWDETSGYGAVEASRAAPEAD